MHEQPTIGTLMLIDDNYVDQMLQRRLIKRSGMVETLLCFLSAEDALVHMTSGALPKPDAILLDIRMPRMDGFAFLEAVRDRLGDQFSTCVVMMLTTSLDARDQARAASFEVVKDFLHKPLSVEHLIKLETLLR